MMSPQLLMPLLHVNSKSEAHISALEDDVAPLREKLVAMEKLNAELAAKVTGLGGCSRRKNIRLF